MGRITENTFRAILNLPLETPFEAGFRQGRASGQPVSRRQVAEHFPEYSDDDLTAYLNGRDDGISGDNTRMPAERAALLWPHRNWREE